MRNGLGNRHNRLIHYSDDYCIFEWHPIKILKFQICDKYNALHSDIYDWFNISFDKFGRTTTDKQTEVAQSIFWDLYNTNNLREDSMKQLFCEKCTRFLADRLEKTELFLRKTRQVLDRSIFF